MDKEFNPNGPFCLSWDEVAQLCLTTLAIVRQEPMVLRLRAPIKGAYFCSPNILRKTVKR